MRLLSAGFALLLAACECSPPHDDAPPAPTTHGEEIAADHGPAVQLDAADLAGISDFELAPLPAADRAERARSWSGRGALLGSPEIAARRSAGNWLCRLHTHFGAPPEITESGFRYILRERATGYVLTAFVDAGGPALGGVLRDDQRPIDLEQMTAIVDRFASLMDATVPAPCSLDLGARTIGVEDGEWFERRGSTPSE
jgi:hypothetical protein